MFCLCFFYLEHSAVQLSQLNAVVARKWISCGWTQDLGAGIEIALQISFHFQDLWCPVWKKTTQVWTKFWSSGVLVILLWSYLISHSFVLSILLDTRIHWNGCKLPHSDIYSSACSLVHTCHLGRLTKGKEICEVQCDKQIKKKKKGDIRCCSSHTYMSHSVSQTSRWHRSNRRGLVGKNEAPCSSGQSHTIVGSFCQTFHLCRLQFKNIFISDHFFFRWTVVFWCNSLSNMLLQLIMLHLHLFKLIDFFSFCKNVCLWQMALQMLVHLLHHFKVPVFTLLLRH